MDMDITEMHTGLCRICIQNEGTALLVEFIDSTPIYDVIKNIFGILITDNKNYSESLCDNCYSQLLNSYEFKQRINGAEKMWKHFCELTKEEERNRGIVCELKVERIDPEFDKLEYFNTEEEKIIPDYYSIQDLDESNNLPKIDILQDKKQTYHCNACERICKSAIDLHRHRKVHNKPGEICKSAIDLHRHRKVHNKVQKRGEICEICNKSFTSKLYLKLHMRTHVPDIERTINCEMCDKSFRTKTAYQMHLKHHNGTKDISCSMCEKLFYHRRDLARHMRTLHLEIKNYSCKICLKKFSNSGNLYTHMRVHTGEKPYECKYCDFKFNQSSPLNKHMEKHVIKGDPVKPTSQNIVVNTNETSE